MISVAFSLSEKAENISLFENCYSEEIIKGVDSQVHCAKLTLQPKCCDVCGCLFDDQFEKLGFKTYTITLPKVSVRIPIRIDLFLFIPLHSYAFYLWFKVIREKKARKEEVFDKKVSSWIRLIFIAIFIIMSYDNKSFHI